MNTTALSARLRNLEGAVAWMYLDLKGLVTVGVGHLLETPEEAATLPFRVRVTGEPASPGLVRADWLRIKNAKPAMLARYYRQFSTTGLSSAAIDQALASNIEIHWHGVLAARPECANFPEPAQQIVAEMAFALGVSGLLAYKKMLAAMALGDWETAAFESHRSDMLDWRNEEMAKLIRSIPAGLAPDTSQLA
jgi:GH24 family phage-related lysozyme (muramidase)